MGILWVCEVINELGFSHERKVFAQSFETAKQIIRQTEEYFVKDIKFLRTETGTRMW